MGILVKDILVPVGDHNSLPTRQQKSLVFRFRFNGFGLVLERNSVIPDAIVNLILISTWSRCWLRSLLLNQEMNQIRHTPFSSPTGSVKRGSVKKNAKLWVAVERFERVAALFLAKSVRLSLPALHDIVGLSVFHLRPKAVCWLAWRKRACRAKWPVIASRRRLNRSDYRPVRRDVLLHGLFLHGCLQKIFSTCSI